LISAEPEQIGDHIKMLERETKEIKSSIIDVCYHMRGGVTRQEAMMMSPAERIEHIEYISNVYKEKAAAMTGQESM